MIVEKFMRTDFVSLRGNATIKRVNQLLHQMNTSYILITDKNNKLEGIITFSDLFRHLLPSYTDFLTHAEQNMLFPEKIEEKAVELVNKKSKEIMTKEPEFVHPNLPLIEAGAFMLAHKVKQLPVVEKGKVVGVISYTDITWGFMLKNCKYF